MPPTPLDVLPPRVAPDDVLPPLLWRSFRGDIPHPDEARDVVQGPDPVSLLPCWGFWLFDLPRLPECPSRAELFLYARHWYYNAGGAAVLMPVDDGGRLLTAPSVVADNWAKPAGRCVELPESWLPLFRTGGAGAGVAVGQPQITSLRMYGRFDAMSVRLRLWR